MMIMALPPPRCAKPFRMASNPPVLAVSGGLGGLVVLSYPNPPKSPNTPLPAPTCAYPPISPGGSSILSGNPGVGIGGDGMFLISVKSSARAESESGGAACRCAGRCPQLAQCHSTKSHSSIPPQRRQPPIDATPPQCQRQRLPFATGAQSDPDAPAMPA